MNSGKDLPMNVSSLVIKTAPEHVEEVIGMLRTSGLCEVFFHDKTGKIVVTIEGRDVSEEMGKLKKIQDIAHVSAVDLAYSYSEHEVMEDLRKIDSMTDSVPEALRSSGIS